MDRYLYLPALALPWLILAGTGPLRAGRFRLALLAALTLVYAGLSLAPMRTFRDERSFWARLLQADPRSSTALTEHARLLIEAGRRAEGPHELERAIQLAPDNLLPAFRLANLDLAEGRAAEAVERYARLIGRSPGYAPRGATCRWRCSEPGGRRKRCRRPATRPPVSRATSRRCSTWRRCCAGAATGAGPGDAPAGPVGGAPGASRGPA